MPVEDVGQHQALSSVLETCLRDNRQAWELHADGTYRQRRPAPGEPDRATHQILQREPWGRISQDEPAAAAMQRADEVGAGGD